MGYTQQPGQADSPDREPERVQPVPEHYEGVNFPYRGTQKHGVEVPKDAEYDTRQFVYEPESPDEYMDPEPEPDPIPVRVISEYVRERQEWRVVRAPVTELGSRVLGRLDSRRDVLIRLPSLSSSVYIGTDSGVSSYTGFQIEQGNEIRLRSTEEVWAICDAGNTSELHILFEYAVEL